MTGQAFDDRDVEMYEQHAQELTRFATGLVGRDDAPDVVADAFVKAMTSRSWAGVSNRRAYLYRAVFNEARSLQRSNASRHRREERAEHRDRTVQPSEPASVVDALEVLSRRQRAVVFLTYWDDLGASEVGRLLGISEGAVRRHLDRAKRRLRGVLDE